MDANDEVERELLQLLQHLTDAMDIMENLEEDNKPALVDTMQSIVGSFQSLHELEPQITGAVPLELIEQIDKGNNPDDYSRRLVEESRLSAQRVAKKDHWMRSFGDLLNERIARDFADEA